jgi:hypothetical protein
MTYTQLTRYVQGWHYIGGTWHNPLYNPLCLENPSPVPEPLLLTWNPSFASWCDSRPLWSLVACVLTSPPCFLPIPFSLSPTVPHFKYMPSYDDITTSASHSRIQTTCRLFKRTPNKYTCNSSGIAGVLYLAVGQTPQLADFFVVII